MPALSSIAESLSEREEDFYEVLPIGSDDDGKRIQADEVDENDVNSLQNSIIDWTEDETWTPSKDTEEVSTSEEETRKEDSESDDSDTDYIPTIRIRPTLPALRPLGARRPRPRPLDVDGRARLGALLVGVKGGESSSEDDSAACEL
uniref:Uncharacterized protein n=1 Tax=Knipowitschia caucasica TaxID=637954 RepID=A0AAV2J3J2_KNICA